MCFVWRRLRCDSAELTIDLFLQFLIIDTFFPTPVPILNSSRDSILPPIFGDTFFRISSRDEKLAQTLSVKPDETERVQILLPFIDGTEEDLSSVVH